MLAYETVAACTDEDGIECNNSIVHNLPEQDQVLHVIPFGDTVKFRFFQDHGRSVDQVQEFEILTHFDFNTYVKVVGKSAQTPSDPNSFTILVYGWVESSVMFVNFNFDSRLKRW